MVQKLRVSVVLGVLVFATSLANGSAITVYATGPYEVWAGNSPLSDISVGDGSGNTIVVPGYYDTPNSTYKFLGNSATTATYSGAYDYFVVGTRSLFALDAVDSNSDLADYISMGNVHTRYHFDADGQLIGSIGDYSTHANIYDIDGLTNDVGLPPQMGDAPGGAFQGFVTLSVPTSHIYGVFVGINDKGVEGETDARKLYTAISSHLSGFQEAVLLEGDMAQGGVTNLQVQQAVNDLAAKMQPGDKFIFFDSSHGGSFPTGTETTLSSGDELLGIGTALTDDNLMS